MASVIKKYGLDWPLPQYDEPLRIEMGCIQYGFGDPVEHYENMRRMIWPELDSHRWHKLILREIVRNKCTVLAGVASSGKSHEAACCFLMEYWCWPDETCVLMSSTHIDGLRNRIWSEMTSLWQRGVDRFPWLAGHNLDSKLAILTDALDEAQVDERRARDFRKGIKGVACRNSAGQWTGINRYMGIKQKRMRLITDEACFPAGTLVDTLSGSVPIESVKDGDIVIGAFGPQPVRRAYSVKKDRLLKVTLADG